MGAQPLPILPGQCRREVSKGDEREALSFGRWGQGRRKASPACSLSSGHKMGAFPCQIRYHTGITIINQDNMESTRTHSTDSATKGKHFSLIERQQMERWRRRKLSVSVIATLLGRHRSSVYRELARGNVTHLKSDLSQQRVYNADAAQRVADENAGTGGPTVKLSISSRLCTRLTYLIGTMRYSPYAALQQASKEGIPVTISLSTLYRCIHLFNFPVSANQLPMGKRRRRKLACTSTRLACNNLRGESIDKRPAEVMLRKEPGHWEMDLVVGAKGGRKALLVLTERVTRFQHITLLPDKSQKGVAKALNMLERQYGAKQFRDVFKTITCDNGSEFLNCPALERSCRSSKPRTKIYYAHPFSSFERGSNENANRLIRRFLPKGCRFDELTQKHLNWLTEWINRYPRKLLNGRSARQAVKDAGLHYGINKSA